MRATYDKEDEIELRRKPYMVGKIEDRLQMDIKDISLEKQYNLIITRWGLGYMEQPDVIKFLKRARSKLL